MLDVWENETGSIARGVEVDMLRDLADRGIIRSRPSPQGREYLVRDVEQAIQAAIMFAKMLAWVE